VVHRGLQVQLRVTRGSERKHKVSDGWTIQGLTESSLPMSLSSRYSRIRKSASRSMPNNPKPPRCSSCSAIGVKQLKCRFMTFLSNQKSHVCDVQSLTEVMRMVISPSDQFGTFERSASEINALKSVTSTSSSSRYSLYHAQGARRHV
jgi:hypothetical protein